MGVVYYSHLSIVPLMVHHFVQMLARKQGFGLATWDRRATFFLLQRIFWTPRYLCGVTYQGTSTPHEGFGCEVSRSWRDWYNFADVATSIEPHDEVEALLLLRKPCLVKFRGRSLRLQTRRNQLIPKRRQLYPCGCKHSYRSSAAQKGYTSFPKQHKQDKISKLS